MATDVGIPVNFQYKFLRNDVSNEGGFPMPLTPPVTERRRQSVDSPLSRPRPRTGSDSSRYQRLSETFLTQRESSRGSPKTTARSSVERDYDPFNSSPSSATRKSFGSFSDEATDAVPNVKAVFTYQKLESMTTTDDSDDWHFNQPNVFLDDNNDNTGAQRKTVDTTPAPHLDDDAPWYEVVSRFLCRHDDEIDLNVGDKIAVTAKYPDLWFQGTNLVTGKQGIFPSLYVKEIPKEIPKAEKEIPKAERDLLASLDQDMPPVPKRLGSLNKQMTEPILPLTKSEEMKTILEMPDETQSMPPRLTKPPVITRVKSPQRSIRAGWMSLDDDNDSPAALSAGLDNPGYIGNGTKKDNSPDSTKATSVSPTSPAVVGTSDVVAKPSIKSRSFIVDDTESDYSEVKFSVVDFEKLTKKVGVVKEASVKDEGARALLEAAKSPVRETKMDFSEDYEELSLHSTTFDKLQRKIQTADVIGKKKLASSEGSKESSSPAAKSDDGIMAPKEITGGLKVKETNRTVYYAKLLGCVQVKRHRGSGALRDAIAKIQKERKAFNVTEKKPCIIEISEKAFSLHDNTDTMEPREPLMYSLFRVISCANLPGSDKVFGVYIKDAEQEVYHCYAFEAEGSNRDIAIAFGDAFKRFYKQLMKKRAASQKQQKK